MPERMPLAGRRVAVTRPAEQAGPLLAALRAAGAHPIAAPAIRVLPPEDPTALRDAAAALERFDWVVCTSANGAHGLLASRATPEAAWPAGVRVAAVGGATAEVLRAAGVPVSFTPTSAVGDALARELPVEGGVRVLWPRGDLADTSLAERLAARGATVMAPIAYRTVADVALLGMLDALRDGRVDAITFASASTVRHVVEGIAAAGARLDAPSEASRPRIVCIGPVTAAAARECGLAVDAVAPTHDDAGMIHALIQVFDAHQATA